MGTPISAVVQEVVTGDPNRDALAYVGIDGRAERLQERFSANYLQPTPSELEAMGPQIEEALRSGRCRVVIPMKERGPVIRPVLENLVTLHQVPPSMILVINDGSDSAALSEVKRFGARLVHRDQVLEAINWRDLLSVLNMTDRPVGKGIAVLAGYLLTRYLTEMEEVEWIMQSDAEVQGYATGYQGFEHLLYGALNRSDARYVKMAKWQRGNERCMAARCMLEVLAHAEDAIDGAKARRARELFERLTPHKWMLTGEFMLDLKFAMDRPFATGYLDESVTAMAAEDHFAAEGKGVTVHVANPNDRNDGENGVRKEAIMQQQISNWLLQMALYADPVPQWGLPEIARLNRTCMSHPIVMGFIPNDEGPVKAEIIGNDRIIPSVNQLIKGEFVDEQRLRLLARGFEGK